MTLLETGTPADSERLRVLGRTLLAMSPEEFRAYLQALEPEDLMRAENAITFVEREVAVGASDAAEWRATPATMMHHLTNGRMRLWRYIALLGNRFVDAFGRSCVVCRARPGKDHHRADCPLGQGPVPPGVDPHQIWNMPSQMGKTSTVMAGIVWALDDDPTRRLMYVTYDDDKAKEEGGNARDIAREYSADLRFQLRPDRHARGRWTTDEGGGLYAVGVYGGIIGYPADGILIDDLIKGWQTAHSAAARDGVMNVYRSQIRFRAQANWTPIIYAGTRWHEDDPPARLVRDIEHDEYADKWTVTRLAAIAEEPQPNSPDPLLRVPDPLGRAPGEVIEPERFPPEEVYARRGQGQYLWAALEQQRPSPVEGTEIKRDWWRIDEDIPAKFDDMISSWDMKLKDKESGDYVVGGVWGRNGSHFWMTALQRGQWNQPTTENAIALTAIREPRCRAHIVENTGNGPEVIESLRRAWDDYVVSDEIAGLLAMTVEERVAVQALRRRGMSNILPENVKGSKAVRMRAQTGIIEARHVHLWKHAPWLGAYLEEMSQFPNGSHDDQVDMTSQALKRMAVGGATVEYPGQARQARHAAPVRTARPGRDRAAALRRARGRG